MTTKRPEYVRMTGEFITPITLRLLGDTYYRDQGRWYVAVRESNGRLYSISAYKSRPELDGNLLTPITYKEWKEDNRRYLESLC